MDYDPRFRDKIVDYLISKWGRECVAHIGTYGSFGMKSVARDLARIAEPLEPKKSDYEHDGDYDVALREFQDTKKVMREYTTSLMDLIPEPQHGIAPDYDKMIKASPQIEDEYPGYAKFASYAGGMRKNIGVHAAGIVLSDVPIHDIMPVWKNDKYDRITQFDKDEVEALGLIKFDELVVDALSVIAETIRLVDPKANPAEFLENIYANDGNEKAYAVLNEGLLTGIWQMETSDSAWGLIHAIKPTNINELSDISALNRPGPLSAKLHIDYINNKKDGIDARGMPQQVMNILSRTYGVLTYQEQVMQLCSELAGFTLKEADDIRRAMGKKDPVKLAKLESYFIDGCAKVNIVNAEQSAELWRQMKDFAEYAFNACLTSDTKVFVAPFWKEKSIEDLQIGVDRVYVVPTNNEYNFETAEVVSKVYSGEQEVFEVIFDDGSIIKCTMEHKFLCTDDKYHPLRDIIDNDLTLCDTL